MKKVWLVITLVLLLLVITELPVHAQDPTPTPEPTPTLTPTPCPPEGGDGCDFTPNPDELYDLFDLPGDYGEIGRMFDFRVIFTVIFGFLDIFGIANVRDFAAVGAAIAVIMAVMFNSENGE